MAQTDIDRLIMDLVGKDGMVPYTEFMGQMIAAKKGENQGILWQIFCDVDQDDSGYLDENEIKMLLERPAIKDILGNKTPNQVLAEMDDNGSGRVNFEEFTRACAGGPRGPPQCAFQVGEDAEYYSVSHNCWIACTITAVDASSAAVQTSCKPKYWLQKVEQATKLRKKGGKGGANAAAGLGRQLLSGALGF